MGLDILVIGLWAYWWGSMDILIGVCGHTVDGTGHTRVWFVDILVGVCGHTGGSLWTYWWGTKYIQMGGLNILMGELWTY